MIKNFVSVSAISDREQLKWISRICQDEKLSFPIAIGYQVSNKSINQGTQNTRQPRFVDLRDLDKETKDYGFITAVHYYTKDNRTIIGDLGKVVELGVDPRVTLLQFNTLPPALDVLEKVKEMGFKVIFKVAVSDKQSSEGGYAVWKGREVEDVSSGDAAPLIRQVHDRRDFVDYAMFDPSHGTNLDLNLDKDSLAIRFGQGIMAAEDLCHLGLVYAGGIKPGNVRALTRSLRSFFHNRFSIDTESGVRIDDKLNLELVREYLAGYREEV
jgi:hypothetical protein